METGRGRSGCAHPAYRYVSRCAPCSTQLSATDTTVTVCTRVTLTVWFSSYYYYVCYTSIRVSHRVSHESGLSGVRVSQAVQALSHISRKASKAREPCASASLSSLVRVSHTTHTRGVIKRSVSGTRGDKRLVGHSNTSTPSCVGTMSCA